MPEYLVRIKSLAEQRVVWARRRAGVAEIGPAIQDALETVWRRLNSLESVTVGPAMTRFVALGPDEAELQAGFPISEKIPPLTEVDLETLAAGVAATTLHHGDYATLPLAYQALEQWMAEQGRLPAAAPWEIYWVDPSQAPAPSDLRTEVVWPIEPSDARA